MRNVSRLTDENVPQSGTYAEPQPANRCRYRAITTLATVVILLLCGTAKAEEPVRPTKEIPAFPGAEGAGKFTVGGRFGSVYRVTNLNASGPGSLADAVSQPNRIVVFTVSGIIDLNGKSIKVSQPHITIAGQTAPGEGICLKGGDLVVRASDVIVRYLRSRRGYISEGNTGDAFTVKPDKTGIATQPANESQATFDKRKQKKLDRGKDIHTYASIDHIIFDHLSASWATDENLSLTAANFTTVQYCIAAEGLDYANPKQTPPNHSEGSLWGVEAANGRSTMHHTLYAHNRLRNPRLTSGQLPMAVLDFRNNVVYDASESFSHTTSHGSVAANWINNYYKQGPSTPPSLRGEMFLLLGNTSSRLYVAGNVIFDFPDETVENWKAVHYGKGLSAAVEKTIRMDKPLDVIDMPTQNALEAYEAVLNEGGASLPARDAVDLRLMNEVRTGTGRVIQKETDLPADQRWPYYETLPAPLDSDGDGIPDYWEEQFGLNKTDPSDSMKIAAGGYANIEHYINNTDPHGGTTPIVFVSAAVSRASAAQVGTFRVFRNGSRAEALVVRYAVSGSAATPSDYETLPESITIPAGAAFADVRLNPSKTVPAGKTVIVTLAADAAHYHIGCPNASVIVMTTPTSRP